MTIHQDEIDVFIKAIEGMGFKKRRGRKRPRPEHSNSSGRIRIQLPNNEHHWWTVQSIDTRSGTCDWFVDFPVQVDHAAICTFILMTEQGFDE